MPKRIRKTLKHLARSVRRSLVYCLTIAFRTGILVFPLHWARRIGEILGAAAFEIARGERRKTLENLRLAYGQGMPPAERLRAARAVFRNAGMSAVELAFLYAGRGGNILSRAKVEGMEHILGVLRSGCGVLLVTAHYGNWELVPPLLVAHVPCEGGVVARDLSNPGLNRTVLGLRRRFGVRVFRRGETGRDYVRFLRAGNALGILGDMDTSRGRGLFVDFFGRPAWTQRGIAQLALSGRAGIVPAFIARDPRDPGLHVLRIRPAISEGPAAPEGRVDAEERSGVAEESALPREARVAAMTQSFTRAIEEAIRERPDQWAWMHRRWRHQPDRPPRIRSHLRARGPNPATGTRNE